MSSKPKHCNSNQNVSYDRNKMASPSVVAVQLYEFKLPTLSVWVSNLEGGLWHNRMDDVEGEIQQEDLLDTSLRSWWLRPGILMTSGGFGGWEPRIGPCMVAAAHWTRGAPRQQSS